MQKVKNPEQRRRVAIFDIDGTIFRSSLLIELLNVLIERGNIDESVRKEYNREHKHWLSRRGDYGSYIGAVVRTFDSHIKGVHYSDFAEASKTVIERYQNHTYRYTRDLVLKLKRKNIFCWPSLIRLKGWLKNSPKGLALTRCTEGF